tara:strand:- start:1459 stop:2208 length:750 start_codon:yes stop_codon:yes gene_type:complete
MEASFIDIFSNFKEHHKLSELDNARNLLERLSRNVENPNPIEYLLSKKSKSINLFSLSNGNYKNWINQFLSNTRLIVEPKIAGYPMILHYTNGLLSKALDVHFLDKKYCISRVPNLPLTINFKQSIYVMGELYCRFKQSRYSLNYSRDYLHNPLRSNLDFSFCAYRIINSKLNHYQNLNALKALSFEIPDTEFTHYVSDIELFRELWLQSRIFDKYPTNGIIIKVNSRKFQKQLGYLNNIPLWAYSIIK